jgi:hypothetical protein
MNYLKRILLLSGLSVLALLLYAGWIKYRSLDYHDGGPPLAIRWEGFYHDMNLRDIGASINGCLGENRFREQIALRSAGWFSGWSCDKVGNPQVIYSLNYSPAKEERYFCQAESGKKIGRYFNPEVQLHDLEIMEAWSDEAIKTAACDFLKDIFISILEEKKILLHCDAGRDRTAAITALLVAMAAEASHSLDERMLNAIECDYRKTQSLTPDKYGRVKLFIQQLQARGSVARFIEQTCIVDPQVLSLVATKILR